jgi:hypothetical protein
LPVDVDERQRHRELSGPRAQRTEDLDPRRAEDLQVVEVDDRTRWCVLGEKTRRTGPFRDESHVEGTADAQSEWLGDGGRK